mmetsp:Transcript_10622/g.30324  ORF Transcript_10622/g.30324 Transcript_10622/m.30324 type:complete len:222 (+) Transcript_10622:871-1536(+)
MNHGHPAWDAAALLDGGVGVLAVGLRQHLITIVTRDAGRCRSNFGNGLDGPRAAPRVLDLFGLVCLGGRSRRGAGSAESGDNTLCHGISCTGRRDVERELGLIHWGVHFRFIEWPCLQEFAQELQLELHLAGMVLHHLVCLFPARFGNGCQESCDLLLLLPQNIGLVRRHGRRAVRSLRRRQGGLILGRETRVVLIALVRNRNLPGVVDGRTWHATADGRF